MIKTLLSEAYSKSQSQKIQAVIHDNQHLLEELIEIVCLNDPFLSPRASFTLNHIFDNTPSLITPYIAQLNHLAITIDTNHSVLRNTLRICAKLDVNSLPDEAIVDRCFDILTDNNYAIAIHAHAMQIVYNFTATYPELKKELKLILEDKLPYGSAGYKSKANKLLKQMAK